MTINPAVRFALSIFLVGLVPLAAVAQASASTPVKVVVPYPAGGPMDAIARSLATDLSKDWSRPVVVENKPGAGSMIGSAAVAKSSADGATFLINDIASTVLTPALFKKPLFDPKELVPVTGLARGFTLLLAPNSLPADNMRQVIAMAKEKPNFLNYGTFGVGSTMHISFSQLEQSAGIKLNHVPYKGAADIIPALISGDVHLSALSPVVALPLARDKKIKVICYTGPTRSPSMPDIPTCLESGQAFNFAAVIALFVAAGTPQPAVDQIVDGVRKSLQTPASRARLGNFGFDTFEEHGKALAEMVNNESTRSRDTVRSLNISLD